MDKAIALAIRMTADASDVERAFDEAGAGAKAMADDVESAARTCSAAGDQLSGVGDKADELGSKTAQAAGGLGDLGGALSAVPGPLGDLGSGMEALSPVLMAVTGATDLLNLATQSNVLLNVRARAATIASTVATKAQSVASKVAAGYQWLLNAAMSANPVGLVILAIVALIAVVVIAYKKSETFRAIVQGAMKAVSGYVQGVVGIVTTLVEFVRDKAPAAWGKLRDAAVDAAKYVADKVGAAFDTLTAPIQAIIDLVQKLIDFIGDIDFPDINLPNLPGIPGLRMAAPGTLPPAGTTTPTTTIDARTYVTIDGTGIVDEAAVARTLEPVLARQATRLGSLLSPPVVPSW